MYEKKLFSLKGLRESFEAIEPDLIRFPSLEPGDLQAKIKAFCEKFEPDSGEETL